MLLKGNIYGLPGSDGTVSCVVCGVSPLVQFAWGHHPLPSSVRQMYPPLFLYYIYTGTELLLARTRQHEPIELAHCSSASHSFVATGTAVGIHI